MKIFARILSLMIALALLLSLAACSNDGPAETPSDTPDAASPTESSANEFDKDGWKLLLDNGLKLVSDYSEELFRTVVPASEIDFNVSEYAKRDKDYLALVRSEYEEMAEHYTQTYGEGWTLSYTVNSVDEKDAEGIEKYKAFDNFYFNSYGIDLDSISAVTFVKLTVKIEGPLGSNTKDKTIQCFCSDNEWWSFYALRIGLKL